MNIISTQLSELRQTIASKRSAPEKNNNISMAQNLLKELNISGCVVVSDAINYQEKTAKTIIK